MSDAPGSPSETAKSPAGQEPAASDSAQPKDAEAKPASDSAAEALVVDESLPAGDSNPESSKNADSTPDYQPKIPTPPLKDLVLSPDPPSRFVSWMAIVFGVLAAACLALLLQRYWEIRKRNLPAPEAPSKPVLEKIITEPLGEFKLVLKPIDSPNDGELRVDVVAECSNVEACQYLKDHLIQARDIVIPVFMNARRSELLSPESKLLLRRKITEQLNTLPLGGKVIQILFTDLTVEDVAGSNSTPQPKTANPSPTP